HPAAHRQRHGPDRIAVRRQPPRVGDERLAPREILHDAAAEDAAEATEEIVGVDGRRPLDRVDSHRPRRRHRARGLPPRGQRLRIEERGEHARRRRADEKRMLEFGGRPSCGGATHAPAMLLQYTGAMTELPKYDASWGHHYADERDAAWLYRRLGET